MTTTSTLRCIVVCVLYTILSSIHAQTNESYSQIILNNEDIQELCVRHSGMIDEFIYYLSEIVDENLTNSQRQESIKYALNLFIGKGDTYFVRDKFGEIEHRNSVKIQISNLNSNRTKRITITQFLSNLYHNIRTYGSIEICRPEIISIDPHLRKLEDNLYQGWCTVKYSNPSYPNNSVNNVDSLCSSTKKEEVFISSLDTPIGCIWGIYLGDIYMTSTRIDF